VTGLEWLSVEFTERYFNTENTEAQRTPQLISVNSVFSVLILLR